MIRQIVLFIILSSIASIELGAQYYSTGQDPASIKWYELNTDHFTIIYPSSYRSEAQKTAFIFEESYKLIGGRYNERSIKKFPVVIHSLSVESNGYVAWAPKRIELYPYPGQNSIPLSHKEQLALHELVHVAQIEGLRGGITRPFEYLLGEQYSGALSIFTPFWFLEGDAVVAESAHSLSGRGRQPDFEKRLKSILLQNDSFYSYDKMISGSFKDYTPDHYQFGYQMAAYARGAYGEEIFSNAVNKIAGRPYLLNPFNISLRENYGITKKGLYTSVMRRLNEVWEVEDSLLVKSSFRYLNPDKRGEYINYNSPVSAGSDSIIAIKSSLFMPSSIVLITNNGESEKRLLTPGYIWPYRLSYSSGIITWAENRTDPRWDNRGYSIIRTYNIETKELKSVSHKSRLFSPSISPDGNTIVASETTPDFKNSLLFLDTKTGSEILRVSTPGNEMPVSPSWLDSGDRVIFISFTDNGEGVMLYNIATGEWESVVEEGRNDLQSVCARNDTIFYVSSFSGIDNIFALVPGGQTGQVTSSRFGVSDVSLGGKYLLFSDYSSGGNSVASYGVTGEFRLLKEETPVSLHSIKEIDSKDKLNVIIPDNLDNSYETGRYRKWKHLFNFHSWMPLYADVNNISFDNIGVSPGATIMSQNLLSTLTTTIGYEYSSGYHLLHTGLLWEGAYPVISLDVTYGGVPAIINDENDLYTPSVIYTGLNASGTLYLPLRFNSGRFNQTLWPSVRLSYKNSYVYSEAEGDFDYGQVLATSRLYFSNLHRMAYRDIYPRWGQVFDISATLAPGDEAIYGPATSLRTTFYTPGLFKNHAVKLRYQFEKQDFEKLIQYNKITFPRGYTNIISGRLSSFSADYAMPLAYPDFNIGSLLYINRIRGGLFYDYSLGSENYYITDHSLVNNQEVFVSYGMELLADFYLFRMPLRFSGGLQTAWLPEKQEPYFNFIFNIDIFGFVIAENPGRYH